MGGAVFTDQAGTIKTNDHIQPENSYIVNDIVIGPLGKGTIDITERLQPLFGHAPREGDGMSLGNTHIESPVGQLFHHDIHGTACWHSRCDTDNLLVLACQLQQRFTKDILETRRDVRRIFYQSFTRLSIKLAGCMPYGDILLCRSIAMPLLSVQMQQLRALHALHLAQNTYQFLDVMTIERSEIADVHTLKDVLLMRDSRLDGIRQAHQSPTPVVLHESDAVQPRRHLELHGVVRLIGA